MRYLSFVLLFVSLGVFATGCTKSSPAPSTTSGSNATTPVDDHEGHDHEGHDHEGHSHDGDTPTQPPVSDTPEGAESPASDEFGAPPAEPQESAAATNGAEPEISLDPSAPGSPE
jgi:hypothetical protein